MTFSLRRKHPITVLGRRWPIWMATSLLGLAFMLHAGPVAAQAPEKGGSKMLYDPSADFKGVREVPGLEVLTRRESEKEFFERMRQEAMKTGERLVFPEEPVLSKEPF